MTVGGDFVDVIRSQARERPDRTAYHYFPGADFDAPGDTITYSALDSAARSVAAAIQLHAVVGDRALLVFPSGLDFIIGFLGCLYAGVTAVPVPAIGGQRNQAARLVGIVCDAEPSLILTAAQSAPVIAAAMQDHLLPTLPALTVEESSRFDPDAWVPACIGAQTTAFLQYTSGSTSAPKGVMVSHGNLIHNEELIQQAFEIDDSTVSGGWLPLYHDMGLIGQVLGVLFTGGSGYLMAPTDFLKAPYRWLEMISRFKLEISGAPNFGYDLCSQRIPDDIIANLDLSSWRLAYNGAEPVRATTLARFAERFSPTGFRPQAFFPCYGLAESTLFVSGGRFGGGARTLDVDKADLGRGRVTPATGSPLHRQSLVSCGRSPHSETDLVIVDPESQQPVPAGTVGEIWLRGLSVCAGYWHGPTTQGRLEGAFNATTGGIQGYLRTGDLGAMLDGELIVTGRLKDLVVIRGRNIYPNDVEEETQAVHPATLGRPAAAFSVDAGEERLVVVQEVRPADLATAGPTAVVGAIRARLTKNMQIRADGVLLIRPGSVLRTTSGKVRRSEMRAKFLSGELPALHEDLHPAIAEMLAEQRPRIAVRAT